MCRGQCHNGGEHRDGDGRLKTPRWGLLPNSAELEEEQHEQRWGRKVSLCFLLWGNRAMTMEHQVPDWTLSVESEVEGG